MSSGEADAYKIPVVGSVVTDTNTSGFYSVGDWWTSPSTSTIQYTYTTKVYMYQITCPRCKQLNWCELDQTVTCDTKLPTRIVGRKKVESYCGAVLQAVKDTVDYQVPVK